MPNERISSASALRECVVLLVTNRTAWPISRSRAVALAPPRIGCPETCSTPSTSRRIALMAADSIRVTRSVSIPRSEIELRFSRSSGPGGQHAQKSDTRVEAVFEVERSAALTETQKRRVVARAGPVLRAVAQDERSQWRNRELATERLLEAPREGPRVPPPRPPAEPPQGTKEEKVGGEGRPRDGKRPRRAPPRPEKP